MTTSRRSFLGLTPVLFAPAVWQVPAAARPDDDFPSQPRALVKEMVIAAHGNVARVKVLIEQRPALAKAAIDWGYGDWEDALGGASHVGNRDIAQLLIANGARPTIFSAAMLGQLDAVKAFVAASPGVEATPGPHGITLLRHAMAGGAAARPVVDYLNTLPAADARPATQPIALDELRALAGAYAFGLAIDDRLVVDVSGQNLTIARPGRYPRGLSHMGDRTFFPAGAPAVRIRFAERDGRMTVSVFDPDLVVTGEKMP